MPFPSSLREQALVPALSSFLLFLGDAVLAESTSGTQPPVVSALDVEGILDRNAAPKESTFDFPGIDRALEPWFAYKERVYERTGLRFGFDYQLVAQKGNNSVGDDSAVGGFARFFGTWELTGRDTDRNGSLVFHVQNRHRIGSGIAPEELGPNFGYAGITAPDFSNQGFGVTELYWRQRWQGERTVELRAGRLNAFGYFNVTPASDSNTSFMNSTIILSNTVSYPAAGSLGVAAFVGLPNNYYVIGTINDANGSYDEYGFDSLGEGDFFKGVEFGWSNRGVSDDTFRFDNVHIALWHRDAVDKPDAQSGWGASAAGFFWDDERRIGTFGRLGWASDGADTLNEKAAAVGVFGNFFKGDFVGLGASWSQAFNSDEDQISLEGFYRWQLAQNAALTFSVQHVENPAFNDIDDEVTVLGLRTRFTF